jgi:hypothetical protein
LTWERDVASTFALATTVWKLAAVKIGDKDAIDNELTIIRANNRTLIGLFNITTVTELPYFYTLTASCMVPTIPSYFAKQISE